jgi:hypothetical protein
MSLLEKSVLFKHPIHFFMVLLTFKTDTVSDGYVYFAVLVSLSYGFCLIPHPSADFSSSNLAPMPLGGLVIICTM